MPWARLSYLALLLAFCAAAASAAPPPGSAWRARIEEDWRLHEARQLAQLTDPSVLRLPSGAVAWPGTPRQAGLRAPGGARPALDGSLDDPCWREALRIAPDGDRTPSFLLSHDAADLYIAAEIPARLLAAFRPEPTALDAAGAVDGVKNGLYSFHTGGDPNPWWQVDLGRPELIGRIVVWNRLDYLPGLHNADNLEILVSDDGSSWRTLHRNAGVFFGGVDQTGPLSLPCEDLSARFVRVRIPAPQGILFHLDEVEVFARDEPERNLALGRPASQSSLSIWSRGGLAPSGLIEFAGHRVALSPEPPYGLLLDGAPLADSATRLEGETLRLECALPLVATSDRPCSIRLARADATEFSLGADWELRLAEDQPLGYGANHLRGVLIAPGSLREPVRVRPEFFVLTPLGVERRMGTPFLVTQPGAFEARAELSLEGPASLVLHATQGSVETVSSRAFLVPSVAATLARARAILADRGEPASEELRGLEGEARDLARRERADGPDPAGRAELSLRARWYARDAALRGIDFDRMLVTRKFTQQAYPDVCLNHMPWVSRPGGDIAVLSGWLEEPRFEDVIRGQLGPGHVHGYDLDWDGRRIVLGYARTKTAEPPLGWLDRALAYQLRRDEEATHLYEIGIDGGGLRQLTDGPWSDLDPAWLPDDRVVFVSERCGYSLQCNEYDKDETSCNLYFLEADGSVRRVSDTKDGDYLPRVLDNGLIAYTRWEYQERSFANIQSVWTVRPDGTFADAIFKQHLSNPWGLEETRSIPASEKLVSIATGHHTLPVGPLTVLSPQRGINAAEGIRLVTPGSVSPEGGMEGLAVPEGGVQGLGGLYATPWALSERSFLVSATWGGMTDEAGYSLYLVDVWGSRELVWDDPEMSVFQPIPLQPRPRPMSPMGPQEPESHLATCVVTDVYEGMPDVPRGTIKRLRISQGLPWPYTIEGGGERYEPDVKSRMINWNPARALGSVPVEPDGSAHFTLPADQAVFFQALDERGREVRRMRSFISLQPGEIRSCNGCHETRGSAPASPALPSASTRAPSELTPPPWGDRAVSFLRDVQPVLDRRCVGCHSGLRPAGGVDLSGGLEDGENRAWLSILRKGLVVRSSMGDDARITPPYAFGSMRSRFIEVLDTTHTERVQLAPEEWERLVTWVDLNGPYHSDFLAKRTPTPPYDLAADASLRASLEEIHTRRCAGCHESGAVSGSHWIDLRDPASTRFLTAPLAREAGGAGTCGTAVYSGAEDPDYIAARKLVEDAVALAWERPRRDVATLGPRPDGTAVAVR